MGKLDMMYHLIDHDLSNQVVSTAVKKKPAGKTYYKKRIDIKTIFSGRIWANRYGVPLNRPWSF